MGIQELVEAGRGITSQGAELQGVVNCHVGAGN